MAEKLRSEMRTVMAQIEADDKTATDASKRKIEGIANTFQRKLAFDGQSELQTLEAVKGDADKLKENAQKASVEAAAKTDGSVRAVNLARLQVDARAAQASNALNRADST